MKLPKLTPTEVEAVEAFLVNGLHALNLDGEKAETPSDLKLMQFVNEHPDRVRFLTQRYYNEPIMDTLNAAVMRVSNERMIANTDSQGKCINDRSRYRTQRSSSFQSGMEFDPKTTPKPLPSGKK